MAVPHYTYLVLKMPSPAGVLSLQGNLKISHDCDTEALEIASTNQVPNTMMEVYAASNLSTAFRTNQRTFPRISRRKVSLSGETPEIKRRTTTTL
jgi:hypothetical protein